MAASRTMTVIGTTGVGVGVFGLLLVVIGIVYRILEAISIGGAELMAQYAVVMFLVGWLLAGAYYIGGYVATSVLAGIPRRWVG